MPFEFSIVINGQSSRQHVDIFRLIEDVLVLAGANSIQISIQELGEESPRGFTLHGRMPEDRTVIDFVGNVRSNLARTVGLGPVLFKTDQRLTMKVDVGDREMVFDLGPNPTDESKNKAEHDISKYELLDQYPERQSREFDKMNDKANGLSLQDFIENSINQIRQNKDSPKKDTGGKIKLFFGTTRNVNDGKSANEFFGDELDTLKFGECYVSIPPGHREGKIERPRKFLIFGLPEAASKHIVLTSIHEKTEKEFYETLSKDITFFPEKSALVFIHGYNNTFAEAAHRAAQIAWDIPFNGVAGFFSWPSSGVTIDYLGDIERADASISSFQEFIEKLITRTNVERLHLIAHSMGNRLLSTTLIDLANKGELTEKLKVINQIILAAPDLDQDVFKNNIVPKIQKVGKQRTLYSSDKDSALRYSGKGRGGRSRLGSAGKRLFLAEGIDTIDASNIKCSGNGHAYIFDTKELLSDLFYLLEMGLNPAQRRLRKRGKTPLHYWLFPE